MHARIDTKEIGYRALTAADLPLMHLWLNRGEALKWYGHREKNLAEIEEEYLPSIEGKDGINALALTYRQRPIGYLQWYRLSDQADYILGPEDPKDAVAIDLFIGEAELIGRGFGTAVIRKILNEVIFAQPDIRRCYIDPDPANLRGIRAYEKVGFRYLRTIENAWEGYPAYLMAIDRSAIGGEIAGTAADEPDREQH